MTFLFDPLPLLGSERQNTDYRIKLSSAIKKADGSPAFSSYAYEWTFQVSTVVDLTSPEVRDVFPDMRATQVPKNAIIQVNFSEPINPFSATALGHVLVKNLRANLEAERAVSGTVKFSNNYRTIEFFPSTVCGTNSCGRTIVCLPGGDGEEQNIEVTLKTPTIDEANAPQARSPASPDGLTDVAGNALKGNREVTGKDNYTWSFSTLNQTIATAPQLVSVSPPIGGEGVAPHDVVTLNFTPRMLSSTVNNENIILQYNEAAEALWYLTSAQNEINKTNVVIEHGPFGERSQYQPRVNSNLLDVYQNCFAPASGPARGTESGQCVPTEAMPYCCYQPADDPSMSSVQPQVTRCALP